MYSLYSTLRTIAVFGLVFAIGCAQTPPTTPAKTPPEPPATTAPKAPPTPKAETTKEPAPTAPTPKQVAASKIAQPKENNITTKLKPVSKLQNTKELYVGAITALNLILETLEKHTDEDSAVAAIADLTNLFIYLRDVDKTIGLTIVYANKPDGPDEARIKDLFALIQTQAQKCLSNEKYAAILLPSLKEFSICRNLGFLPKPEFLKNTAKDAKGLSTAKVVDALVDIMKQLEITLKETTDKKSAQAALPVLKGLLRQLNILDALTKLPTPHAGFRGNPIIYIGMIEEARASLRKKVERCEANQDIAKILGNTLKDVAVLSM